MPESTPENGTRLIPLSKGFHAVIDSSDYATVAPFSWFAKQPNKDPDYVYAATSRKNGKAVQTIYMHRLIMHCPPGKEVDHKDKNRLNCRRSNLEIVTHQKNMNRRWHKARKDPKS